ncbi:MAG: hypothetical protein ACXWN4_00855 [Candidatus Limnocylindrales bacterium]
MREPDRDSTPPEPGPDYSPGIGDLMFGRGRDLRLLSVVLLAGFAVLWAGLEVVSVSPQWGFSVSGALGGILSQLPVTGPAAVLVAAAVAANVLAGAAVLRLAGTPTFRSLTDLVLGGFAAAVILDAATLFVLGGVGLYGWPELLLLHAAVAATWYAAGSPRLLAGPVRAQFSRPAVWWPLVLAVWAGPLIVQLASPTVPFLDVLPNHVAPVEHVRIFGSFATLTTSPSPIYGPSRLILGYVALLSQVTTITNLDAVLAEAAFGLPLTILLILALRRLAGRLFGGSAGFWVLLTFPLSFMFMRIPDARDTVVVFPLAALALVRIAEELRPRAGEPAGGNRPDLILTFALGGAFLMHPIVGLVTFTAAAGALLLYPARLGRKLIPAMACGAIIAIPQVLTMSGIGAPAWVGIAYLGIGAALAFPLAAGAAWVADRVAPPRELPAYWHAALLVVAILALLRIAQAYIAPPDDPVTEVPRDFVRILDVCLLGALVSGFRLGRGWILLGCGIAAGLGAWAASGLVGTNGFTEQAIHFEVPKTLQYWIPAMLAIGAAGGLAAILRQSRLGLLRPVAIGVFLVVSLFPTTSPLAIGPLVVDDSRVNAPLAANFQVSEHRGAESLGLAMFEAELGYWDYRSSSKPYTDPRLIIDAPRREVVAELRAEEQAGRLGPSTKVLNIASSFQQWVAIPIGVFTGAMETSISLDPEVSIHTEGGRLLGFGDLERELASDYGYVVLEPDGLPPDVLANIRTDFVAYGFHPIWSNSQATIYAHR